MARTLKLMLVKPIPGLGALGDVVKVSPGYARNYLVPRGFAAPVSKDAVKRVAAANKRAAVEAQKAVDNAKAAQDKMRSVTLHIEAKAGEGGHLYGSVTAAMIAEALAKQGIGIDASAVNLENPIKELGIYTVTMKIHAEVTGVVKVYVVQPAPEKGEAAKADPKKPEPAKPAEPAKAVKPEPVKAAPKYAEAPYPGAKKPKK